MLFMDRLLGSIIDDYTLYRIIEISIGILILAAVYLGVHITLTLKFSKNAGSDGSISRRKSFIKSSIFIFIAGFFMLIHEFLEGLKKDAPDYTTYEFFELIALLGLVLFLCEWRKILKNNGYTPGARQ